jgi:D-tyrosyl-tRNA(Tyr) deacylase
MIGLIQRVTHADVSVDGATVGAIGPGLVALIGVEREDGAEQATRLLDRILHYRVFPDPDGRMNLSLTDTDGGLLLVPQFTLAADTGKGTRPSFTPAADPERGQRLFEKLAGAALARHQPVATGRFGAHMQVSLTNDGPVTFWLTARAAGARPRRRGRP